MLLSLLIFVMCLTYIIYRNRGNMLLLPILGICIIKDFLLLDAFYNVWLSVSLQLIDVVTTLDFTYFSFLVCFLAYLLLGIALFFAGGHFGSRMSFYLAESLLGILLSAGLLLLRQSLRYQLAFYLTLGTVQLTEAFAFTCCIVIDILTIVGTLLIVALTGLVLTFGVEYMTREAMLTNVLNNLILFSGSILCFLLAYSFGLILIFWELAGTLSLFLIDTYYSRIRTTQAVTRTYTINKFSDMWLLLASGEIYALCNTDALGVIFRVLPQVQLELSYFCGYLFDVTIVGVIIFSLFCAALCKCAQFLLFVWLPDAMEAPTPASALIHSSTLVVMGIFLLLRFSPILHLSTATLTVMLILGAITAAYGAVYANWTSDLKKAVAYSTISQIGYLFCGCAMLAFHATLIYLVVHAICKALLFIFVGYVVHMFGGTTSLKKMGGVFYIIPDIAINMFIVCLVLAGAPYTVGFFAKELIVYHIISLGGPCGTFVLLCWIITFLATPFYLYRICILPLFGKPRTSRRRYRNIAPLYAHGNFVANDSDITRNVYIHKFISQIQRWSVQGRLTTLLHVLVIAIILLCGEFLVLLVSGFFGTSTTLFPDTINVDGYICLASQILPYYRVRNIQLLIVVLFGVATCYCLLVNNQSRQNIIFFGIVLPVLLIVLLLLGGDLLLSVAAGLLAI